MPITLLSQGDTIRLATLEAASDAVFAAAARAEEAALDVEGVGIVVENLDAIRDAPSQAAAAEQAALDAQGKVVDAQGVLTQTQTARDAAFTNANVYPDIATGLAATTNGQQFQAVSGVETIRYRRDSATTQTEVARLAKAEGVPRVVGVGVNSLIDPALPVTTGFGINSAGSYVSGAGYKSIAVPVLAGMKMVLYNPQTYVTSAGGR